MKVLRQGINPDDKVYKVTCHKCKALIEFKRYEAVVVTHNEFGLGMEIICPVCNGYVACTDNY